MDSSVLGPLSPPASDILSSPARLEALRRTALMDSPAEEAFDRLTRLASRLLGTQVAICTLFDAERHFFKSVWGLPVEDATSRQRPLALSFCQLAAVQGGPLIIPDTRQDERLKDHPGVRDFNIASYLGIPLITSEGHALGTFCVFDPHTRVWREEEIQAAKDLAAVVMTEIEMRTLAQEAQQRAALAQGRRRVPRRWRRATRSSTGSPRRARGCASGWCRWCPMT